MKNAAGSAGHRLVYNVEKKTFKIRFKPYQAARWANNIGKFARAGSVILPIAVEVYAVVSEERQEVRAANQKMRRRNAVVGQVLSGCDQISREELAL